MEYVGEKTNVYSLQGSEQETRVVVLFWAEWQRSYIKPFFSHGQLLSWFLLGVQRLRWTFSSAVGVRDSVLHLLAHTPYGNDAVAVVGAGQWDGAMKTQ